MTTTAAVAFTLPMKRVSPRSRVQCNLTDNLSNFRLSITHGDALTRFLNVIPANSTTEETVSLLRQICYLITPRSSVYISELSVALALRKFPPAAVLTWRDISTVSPFRKKAAFAVTFYIRTHHPFSSIDFAVFLAYFMRTYPPTNFHRAPLQRISYVLRPDGVCGVLLCGEAVMYAFSDVVQLARRDPSTTISGWPVTTWPSTAAEMRHPRYVHQSFRSAKRLGCCLQN
ncbi:hypothetical protein BJ138DRAFT_1119321 [Hygrophoropsis aurantiaca]|uniref:Uncharacterized protein n=1 Tax=Hygrophoropsis aurantiaca TaxID=72124 RepID=A0ACB7ZTK4_9AGAM|nr:hypothetical protein BJ138DRAFT_1119321 [Hygrophoropsis aurantiaca]